MNSENGLLETLYRIRSTPVSTQRKTSPTCETKAGIRTQATWVGGERCVLAHSYSYTKESLTLWLHLNQEKLEVLAQPGSCFMKTLSKYIL